MQACIHDCLEEKLTRSSKTCISASAVFWPIWKDKIIFKVIILIYVLIQWFKHYSKTIKWGINCMIKSFTLESISWINLPIHPRVPRPNGLAANALTWLSASLFNHRSGINFSWSLNKSSDRPLAKDPATTNVYKQYIYHIINWNSFDKQPSTRYQPMISPSIYFVIL